MGWNWAIWAGTELPLLSSSTAGPAPSCSGKTLCHSVVTSHLSSYQSSFVCFTHLLLPDTNQDRCHGRGVLSVVICSRHLFKISNLRGLLSINSHTKSSWASARAGIGESIWRAGRLKHQGPKNVPGRCYWTTISIAKPWILTTSIWRRPRRKGACFFFGDAERPPSHWQEYHGLLQTRLQMEEAHAGHWSCPQAEAGSGLTLTGGTTERGRLAKGHATISGTRIKHQKLLPPSAGNLRWETRTEHEEVEIWIMYPKCHKSCLPLSCKHSNSTTKHFKFWQDYSFASCSHCLQ